MRISILSILIALTVIMAGPLAFAGQEQVTKSAETLTETSEAVEMTEVTDQLAAEASEDCTNSVDDDGDERIDCEDTDCVEYPNCKGGY